jgi:hypothetical protein
VRAGVNRAGAGVVFALSTLFMTSTFLGTSTVFEGVSTTLTVATGASVAVAGRALADESAPSVAPTTNVTITMASAIDIGRRSRRAELAIGSALAPKFVVLLSAGRLVGFAARTGAVARAGTHGARVWPSLLQKASVSSKARRQLGQSFMTVDLSPSRGGDFRVDVPGYRMFALDQTSCQAVNSEISC